MTIHATGTFAIAAWNEAPYAEPEGEPKLTRADVRQTFSGDITGTGAVVYLMAYPDATTASYVGLTRIEGNINGRAGSFIVREVGTFANGVAESVWTIIPDTGTGDLRGIRGSGGFGTPEGQAVTYSLDYDLDESAAA